MIALKLQEHDGGGIGQVMFVLGWTLLSVLTIRERDSILRDKGPGGKMLMAGQGCVLDTMREGKGD